MVEIEETVISVIQIRGRESCHSRHSNALTLEINRGQKHMSQCFPFLAFIYTQKDHSMLVRAYNKLLPILFINLVLF